MILQCPKCKKQYNVPEERLTEKGVKITCPACKHQFIVRKRADEGGAKKKDKKKDVTAPPKSPEKTKPSRKTPPCAVCGEPSTHVFQGPPPRPLCQYHYQIEKEKDSRFFEEEPQIDDGQPQEGASTPEKTVSPGQPGNETVPPQVSGPAFESFDDDFDFMDDADTADSAGPPEQTGHPQPPPGESGSFGLETEDAFTGDNIEGAAASVSDELSSPPPSDKPGPEERPQEDALSEESPPSEGPFRPSADDAPEQGPGGLGEEVKPEESMELSFSKNEYLTGEASEEFADDVDEDHDSFAFQEISRQEKSTPSGDPFSAKNIIDEPDTAEATKPPASRASSEAAQVPLRKSVTEKKKIEQKGVGTPLLVIFLIIVASLGCGYVSYAGLAGPFRSEVNASPFEVPEWEGDLGGQQGISVTSMAVSPGEGLGSVIPGQAGREAMRYLRKDTEKGYENALARIDKALEEDPKAPDLLALYIHALVFTESLGGDGEINLSAGRARAEMDNFSTSLLNKDAMVRARAHVLLGERQFEKARQLLRGYLDRNDYDPLALSLMGESYLYQDDPDPREAIEYLESAVRLDQGPVRAHWGLALAYRMTGRYQEAKEVYELIKEKSPERPGVDLALGEVKQKIEENTSPVLDIAPDKKETVAPIKKTGARISINVLEVISEVGPQIRKFDPEAARQRQAPTYRQPKYAPPPEAAPQ